MDQQTRQSVALMRYSAISPLVSGQAADYPSTRGLFFVRYRKKGSSLQEGKQGISQLKRSSGGTASIQKEDSMPFSRQTVQTVENQGRSTAVFLNRYGTIILITPGCLRPPYTGSSFPTVP